MNLLIIIPARGGSKRVEKKNKKTLGGKPLIAWTIDQVVGIENATIVVSTDDKDILSIAQAYENITAFRRQAKHATDTSSIINVIEEVLDYFDGKDTFDAIMLLQPTSPFRTRSAIDEAIKLFQKGCGESVVSVSPVRSHPYWCKEVRDGIIHSFDERFDATVRSQDLPNVYQLNGLIYVSTIYNFRKRQSLYSEKTRALIIKSEEESLDIDTPFDWMMAEAIVNKGGKA